MTAPDSTAPRAVPCLRWAADTTLELPGSKSVANRLLVAAALCGREVTVRGVSPSDDVQHLLAGLTTLGFTVQHERDREVVRIGPRRADARSEGELFCGNAGTALRFLVSVAAITPFALTIATSSTVTARGKTREGVWPRRRPWRNGCSTKA
jgi:5-enolpyruvylshikimate-3-phosphate synthase